MAIAAVRAAVPSDVEEIVRIQSGTWEAAYAAFVPAEAVAALRSPQAREAWTAAVGTGRVLVATEGEWTVGFCAATLATAPDDTGPDDTAPEDATQAAGPTLGPEAWGEVGALLVEARWGRRGHGGRLLAAAAEALRDAGAIYGLAWVPEPDESSRRFYARAGWEPDGTVRVLDTGVGTLREVRLTGSLELKLQDA